MQHNLVRLLITRTLPNLRGREPRRGNLVTYWKHSIAAFKTDSLFARE